MGTSNTFLLEPGNDTMFEDYAALYNAIDSLDNPDHIEISGEYFRSSFSHPSVEIGRDIVLVQNSERVLVAAGTIFSQKTIPPSSRIMVQVHPDFQNRGIGSMVLEHLFQLGIKRGSVFFECRVPSFRFDAISFVEFHGFEHEYSWIKMQLEYDKPVKPRNLPRDLKFRSLDLKRELKIWAELHNEIYKDSTDYSLTTVKSLKAQIKHVNFDPELLIICEVNGKPVGIGSGWSIKSENEGSRKKVLQIQGLGILPNYRRRGYGQALLYEILNRAFRNDYRIAELVVYSTNHAAIGLYTKYKFQERYRHLWYKRIIC